MIEYKIVYIALYIVRKDGKMKIKRGRDRIYNRLYRQIYRQADRQINRETDRQINREKERKRATGRKKKINR